jgi:hypothetical protein
MHRVRRRGPEGSERNLCTILIYARDNFFKRAYFNNSEDRDEEQSEPDKEELDNFSEDSGHKTAEANIAGDSNSGGPQTNIPVPAKEGMQDKGHGIKVYAGDEESHNSEGDTVEHPGFFIEAEFKITGDRFYFTTIIEGHHINTEEEHSGDSANPVEMGDKHSIFKGIADHTKEFKGAEVSRKEGEAGDPGRVFPTGKEEVLFVFHKLPKVPTNAKDESKVNQNYKPVNDREPDSLHIILVNN